MNTDLFIKGGKCDDEHYAKSIIETGAFKRGIQNDEFRSEANFRHLQSNINQILSYKYNYPIVVDPSLVRAVIYQMATTTYDPQDLKYLNKRVLAKIELLFRQDQHDIKIANEWEDEEFDVLRRNEETTYNPNTANIRVKEDHPVVYVEM